MSLGPAPYDSAPVELILHKAAHQTAITSFVSGECRWSAPELAAVKAELRAALREMQEYRCAYCRRRLILERRNVYEDIEHFLDKSKDQYLQWAFCPKNLVLACHACNVEKNTKDLGGTFAPTAATYPADPATYTYTWIHPHFDDYHNNIEIGKGWIYSIKNAAQQSVRAAKNG